MNSTVSITEAQAGLPRLVRELERRQWVRITRRDAPAAYLVSADFLESLVESLESGASPEFRAAWTREKSGRGGRSHPLSALDDED